MSRSDITFKNPIIVCIAGPVRMIVDGIVPQNFSHSIQLVLVGKSRQIELWTKVDLTLQFGLITSVSLRSIFGNDTEVVDLKTCRRSTWKCSLKNPSSKSLLLYNSAA